MIFKVCDVTASEIFNVQVKATDAPPSSYGPKKTQDNERPKGTDSDTS